MRFQLHRDCVTVYSIRNRVKVWMYPMIAAWTGMSLTKNQSIWWWIIKI